MLVAGGCKETPKTVVAKESGSCDGVPEISFDPAIADPAKLLDSGNYETVLAAQTRFLLAHEDHQLPVIILPSLNRQDIAIVSDCLGNRWEREGKIDGDDILILLAPKERRVRIATGNKSRADLPDAEAAKIIEKMTKIFADSRYSSNRYGHGIATGIGAIQNHMDGRQ